MDEDLTAELREQFQSAGLDEDSADEVLGMLGRHHDGPCCGSCQGEFEDGFQGGGPMMDGWCCCRDERMPR